ncbi:hypothetical protein [Anaerobacillus sp. 1_MG-2023]|uniref:hypothetical protein n=1 Tax=Anaerobacillus sp. 1_MG-2023 TaxID=3062655 RepID=UPI0026E335E8|nr:hypothetical protein [Anaerobacillus sp. 1_MG-2023]MDO6657394.1 hypothetical protein [Anaerobacillus sp. 1_MG-2023]
MSFLEMRMEEHYSYLKSISNLAMLKIFHDAGVDVKKDNKFFMTDIQFEYYTDFDIFHTCSVQLFEEVKSFGYKEESSAVYESDNKSVDEKYPELINEHEPEHTFLLHHSVLKEVLESKYRGEMKDFFESQSLSDLEASFEFLPDNTGIYVAIYFPGDLHEMAFVVVTCLLKAKEIKKKLEDENGISNKDIRSVA